MTQTARPRRSVLYMPGANTRALEKARGLPADALIFDLEDAVAPDAKVQARANVVAAAQSKAYGRREIAIRCNGLATPWGKDDVGAIAKSGADAILVPKLDDAGQVREIVRLLDAAGAPREMAIWGMVETPRGVLGVDAVAGASPRLQCLVMGTNDLVKDMRARHTPLRLPMVTALGLAMLAARAHGLAILDGVHNDIQDEAGFRDACVQGLEMGFDGKTLIHPSQIAPCNEVFAPSPAELEMADKIVAAFAKAQAEGKGVATVDGRMIENLHVEQARRQLAMAAAIRELGAA